MDRADRAGLGVALIGHVLLFGALSLSLLQTKPKLPPMNPAIEVALVDAKSLQTAAPDAVKEASAPPAAAAAPAAPTAAPEPIAAPPPPKPVPAPPQPKAIAKTPVKAALQPTPKPKSAAAQKATTTPQKKPAANTPPRTSRLGGLGAELSQAATRETDRPGTGRGTADKGSGTPSAKTAAQLEASFIQALFVRIKKFWRAPTGVDAELLRSNLVVTLNRDGTIGTVTVLSQSGENENNANLKALHAERAVNAVRRAAPFELPPEHYAIWQSLGPITFDKRLN